MSSSISAEEKIHQQRGIVLAISTAILGPVSLGLYLAGDREITTIVLVVFGCALVSAFRSILEFQRARRAASKSPK